MRLAEAAQPLNARLVGQDREFRGCSTDSRRLNPGEMFIALRGERFNGHDFVLQAERNGAGAALVEFAPPSVTLPLLQVADTRKAIGMLAAHWRARFDIPVVAITGSNGKTTVKELVSSILSRHAPVCSTQGNLNNDIGVPITLFALGEEHRFGIVEMGANHKGEIAYLTRLSRPTIAVITQCAPAHLEGFGSIEGVARAKAEIYEGLPPGGAAVINADDRYAGLWRELCSGLRQLTFGLKHTADVTARDLRPGAGPEQGRFTLITPRGAIDVGLSLQGRHNIMNALAASACAEAIGIPLGQICSGLEAVRPVKGRLQLKPGLNRSRILDDTYNANPASLLAALDVLRVYPGRRWLVLGDMGELGEAAAGMHRDAGEAARERDVEQLFAFGDLSRITAEGFGSGARHFESIQELVRAVQAELAPDVTVLVKGSRAMAMERVVDALCAGG
ncbi:MAG: UDP-N-acetylmuramoyl-tripeptide--D-alanyl-D-alanine ligase [Gammaproteobacteria bacterium]|nr:UDP-N-acetylmuramoyl-tripeptide--D-alanyl-D-alanine ligase [Gammaproteobacteria bacterium]